MDSASTIANAQVVLAIMGAGAAAIVLWLAVVLFKTVTGRP